ncbi:hypothetical protein [Citreimonas salinaria]|uniref:Uncharacterized protein n=1 Tax=Citreimonas salinaria TaxID=321339 RepID=A0A1H3GY71_9RHOB|nr:hypothetical protein [Citreimonas salinaria]SDY07905.1 hypothetical protein SAMN05444340_103100 [Citreimonas salinaria]
MPRWVWFLPLALIVSLAALQAFRLGWLAANLTEGDAILAYVERYVALAGPQARAADCVAVPGQGGWVWITVICAPPDGPGWRFDVNRLGGLVGMTGPDEAPRAPGGAPRT